MDSNESSEQNMRIVIPENDKRLLIELEFIQNLSNPKYLNYLAQNGYLQQDCFINFLKYLQYWKEPQYTKLLVFPQCLSFLEALIYNPSFRRELLIPQFIDYIHQQQGLLWMNKYTKQIIEEKEMNSNNNMEI
jgi:mediator of RNA polymerase II transcription subunit 31